MPTKKSSSRRPNSVAAATLDKSEPFVELPFLPFKVSADEFRPGWAERGKRKRAWDSLSTIERRVVHSLLETRLPKVRGITPMPRITKADITTHEASCLEKLGFRGPAELLEFHRAWNAAFLRRMGANPGKAP